MCVCVQVEERKSHLLFTVVSSLRTLSNLVFETGSLTDPDLAWLIGQQDPKTLLSPPSQNQDFKHSHATTTAFCMGSGMIPLLTEQSLQPLEGSF